MNFKKWTVILPCSWISCFPWIRYVDHRMMNNEIQSQLNHRTFHLIHPMERMIFFLPNSLNELERDALWICDGEKFMNKICRSQHFIRLSCLQSCESIPSEWRRYFWMYSFIIVTVVFFNTSRSNQWFRKKQKSPF